MSVNGVEDEEKTVEAGNPGNVVTDNLTMNPRTKFFFQDLWTKFCFYSEGILFNDVTLFSKIHLIARH